MDRAKIVDVIRDHLNLVNEGVVWLTERGAIVVAPDGSADLVSGVGREYFKERTPLLFIRGTVGLSGFVPGSMGTGADDDRMHDLMWKDFDESRMRPPLGNEPVKVADEVIESLTAKYLRQVLEELTEEEKRTIRNADEVQRNRIVDKLEKEAG